MPKTQGYAMDNVDKREEGFRKLYSLIGNKGVQIGIEFRGNNQVTFNIVKDDEIIELVTIVKNHGTDEILIQDGNFVILDRFTPQDEGYSSWEDLLQKSQSKNIELIEMREMKRVGLYDGEVFLNSILPSLGKALNPNAVGRFSSENSKHNDRFANDAELARLQIQREKESEAPSTSTQSINGVSSTTVDTTEKTTEDPNFILDIDPEIFNETATESRAAKLFDFKASKKAEEERLESTTQEIRESNAEHNIFHNSRPAAKRCDKRKKV